MSSKNIIANSLRESIVSISKNKKIFSLIFILQLLFFILIIGAASYYMSKIFESSKEIIDYTESQNLNINAATLGILQQKNPLGDDPLLISRNYNNITNNFYYLLFWIFVIFSLVNGLVWHFSSNFLNNKRMFSFNAILYFLTRFFVLSIILFIFAYLLLYNFARVAFSSFLATKPVNFVPLLIIAIVAIYFLYIAIPLLNIIKNRKHFKKSVKNILSIGTKKFVPLLSSFLIILSFILISLLLLFYSMELNLFLLLVSIILLILIFSWSKIYFSIVVRKLSGF